MARAVLRRAVPREHRDAFVDAFFHDLAQQPLGPGVINSVSTFLQRVDELPRSKLPAASDVRAVLAQRGLAEAKIKEICGMLGLARGQQPPAGKQAPVPDADAIAREQKEQLEALADLHDWFNDWSTSLRRAYSDAERRRLGLRVRVASADDRSVDEDHGNEDAPE